MSPRLRGVVLLAAAAVSGCATKGDVVKVQTQVAAVEASTARRDSAHARQVAEVIRLQQQMLDSLAATTRAIKAVRGELGEDLYNVQQQLVQLQELTGQSQRRLTELRAQLEARAERAEAGAAGPTDTMRAAAGGEPPSADQIYESSLDQLRRGSPGTARAGFRELLRLYPANSRVPDALYFVGESFAAEYPDSAAAQYDEVVRRFPKSARAPTALYKLGLLAERRNDIPAARGYFERVVKQYPTSDEAALARDKLSSLGH